MDDVVAQVVLAGGDEDLLPRQPIRAVIGQDRSRANQRKIGAAMRLGQVHGARPSARCQLRKVHRLLGLAAVGQDGRIGALRETRIHAESQIGRGVDLVQHRRDHERQTLSAELRSRVDGRPAALRITPIGFGETVGHAHRSVRLKPAALPIADPVQRLEDLLGEGRSRGEDRASHVARHLRETREIVVAGEVEDVLEQEEHLIHWCRVTWHRGLANGGHTRFESMPENDACTIHADIMGRNLGVRKADPETQRRRAGERSPRLNRREVGRSRLKGGLEARGSPRREPCAGAPDG